jgi:hypothetical protein
MASRSLVRHLPVLLACLLLPAVTASAAGLLNIEVRADPDSLPADGQSQAVVIAEVISLSGAPVPDGTPVYFSTDLGDVVSPVQTLGGLAQTALTASTSSGLATVSAMTGGARATTQVEFLATAGSGSPGSKLAELTADEIAYSADRGLFVATWHAQLTHRMLTITADSIQYEVVRNFIRAQGNVVMTAGKHEQRADALGFDLLSHSGRLLRVSGEQVERLCVDGDRLEVRPDTSGNEALWDPIDTGDTRTWVKATRVLVEPGKRLILDHAVIYVDDTKVMSLPRQVLPPVPNRAIFSQALGFSSVGGVRLEFPYYYRASGNSLGSLTLRRNALSSGPGGGLGWALGLREEYSGPSGMNGSFTMDSLLHPTRGLGFEHSQRFGKLRVGFDAHAATLYDDSRFRAGNLGFTYPVGEGAMALSLGGSTYGRSREESAGLTYQFASRRLGNGLMVMPNVHIRESMRQVDASEIVIDPVTGEPLELDTSTSGTTTSAGFDVALGMPTRELRPGTRFTGHAALGAGLILGGSLSPSVRARFSIDQQLGKTGRLTLTYNGSYHPSDNDLLSGGRQTLTLAGNGTYKDVSYMLSFSKDVTSDRQYGVASLSQPLPFGKDRFGVPMWTLGVNQLFTHYRQYDLQSTRIKLTRRLGKLDLSLNYSPQGFSPYGDSHPWISPLGVGYTYTGGRHLWLEFGAPIQ